MDETEPGSAGWWDAHLDRLRRRRPRVGGLTVERIVDEALRLIDAEGLEALTVRRLTAELDTGSASLYRHVASVDELLVLVVDRVLGEIDLPDDTLPGRERVVELTLEFRRVLRRHPNVVPALAVAPPLGPNATRSASSGLANLLDAGIPPDIAIPAYLVMIDYVLGSVFFDTASVTGVRRRADATTSSLDEHRDLFEAVVGDDVFRSGLDALLDGFELRVSR